MNLSKTLIVVSLIGASTTIYAKPYSEAINGEMLMKGGSESMVSWSVPSPGISQVYVSIPKESTAKNATYRIYPKGTGASTICSSADADFPCFEAVVNQAKSKGNLVQLKSGSIGSWNFTMKGTVRVVADNSLDHELVGAAGARFNQVGQTLKYSKIGNTGSVLSDDAQLGTGNSDWSCTRDNNTSLVWEIKTSDKGLRDQDNQYAWYDPNPSTNGGNAGAQDGAHGLCTGGINCDTDAYVSAVNALKLCGYSDWRMPSYRELVTLLKPDVFPAIDADYFPNTSDFRTWSSTTDPAYNTNAWFVYFGNGSASSAKSSAYTMKTRLVRGGGI